MVADDLSPCVDRSSAIMAYKNILKTGVNHRHERISTTCAISILKNGIKCKYNLCLKKFNMSKFSQPEWQLLLLHNIVPARLLMCPVTTLMARFLRPTWGPSWADRTQVGPRLAPWTLLSGYSSINSGGLCDMGYPSETHLNSSPPRAAYMRQWIGSALVQIMACRLFSAKPVSKPVLDYYQLHP